MSTEFDRYQSTYSDAVNRSISFAGADVDFFAELKAIDLLDVASRRLRHPSGLSALDFGCGTGIIDALVAPHVGSLSGVDVSSGLIAAAKEANPDVDYRHYDGSRLSYEDGTFDLAFAICVLHHIDPPTRSGIVAELARVLRPGGVAAIYEHNPLNPLTRVAVSRCEFDEGVELLRLGETRRLLAGAGMRPLESRFIAFFPRRGRRLRAAERRLARLPLGGQYVVAAAKPESS